MLHYTVTTKYFIQHMDNPTSTRFLSLSEDKEAISYLLQNPEIINSYNFSRNGSPFAVKYLTKNPKK